MRDTGLADRLRARGLRVVEVAGWRTRGSDDFAPRGSVNHHTAGSANGAAPSLAICTYGRSDLPGPLCQVLLGRDLVAYVIAAGRANHAGPGSWRGLIGNRSVHGLEIEHVGSGTSPTQLSVAAQIHAAFLEAPGQSGDPDLVCQHFEWAPTRKVDFRALAPYTPDSFRAAVAAQMEDDMTPDEVTAACSKALRNMTRTIQGVGGGPNADAVWADYVYQAARESLADEDVTNASIAAAVTAVAPALATALADELAQGVEVDVDPAVFEGAAERAIRRALGSLDGA